MSDSEIHSSSIVAKEAKIGRGVKIGPFCLIGPDVVIGDDTIVQSHVVIDGHTEIGVANQFFSFCSIGRPPQDSTYKNEPTKVIIGSKNIFREYVSIHRGTTKENMITKIGDENMLMAHVHVGHDVLMGNKCVVANSTNFAGHVKVSDRVIIGGGTNISQFVSLGRGAYIGGASGIDRDIPIFCTAYGNRARLRGVNIIGMRRQGIAKNVISEVVDFYRMMEASALSPRSFIDKSDLMKDYINNEIIQEMCKQIKQSEIGIAPFTD